MKRSALCWGVALLLLAAAAPADDDPLEDPIDMLDDDRKIIGQLPAERYPLPFDGDRGDARLGVTRAGHVYVALGRKLCWTEDGGRSWHSRDLPVNAGGFGVLRDDTFIVFSGYPQCGVIRSTDYGRTWSKQIPLDLAPFTSGGGG
jgi:hypothetical protein